MSRAIPTLTITAWLMLWGLSPTLAHAAMDTAAVTYQRAIALAADGQHQKAEAMLAGAASVLPSDNIWQQRMQAAVALLAMERQQAAAPSLTMDRVHQVLIDRYLHDHLVPRAHLVWLPALLAIVPGAGHLWLGRLHDAATAALLVWPMLLLTWWAARRHMGPVTVFFGIITIWLWSGSIFSALSLAERGDLEIYRTWWQGLWQAAALPGRPW